MRERHEYYVFRFGVMAAMSVENTIAGAKAVIFADIHDLEVMGEQPWQYVVMRSGIVVYKKDATKMTPAARKACIGL